MPALIDDIGVAIATKLAERGVDKAVESAPKVKNVLARLWKRLLKGQVTIIITGLGGAGKTSLKEVISGQRTAEELDGRYHLSRTNEKTSLQEDRFVSVYTRPGQASYHSDSVIYEEVYQAIGNAKSVKVINVVSYGYESLYRIALAAVPGHVQGQDPSITLSAYLERQRDEERERLGELLNLLATMPASKKIDIITVINKADLWHDRNAEVVAYYEGESYGARINAMLANKGGRITHSMTSGSLIPVNLRTHDGHVLAPVLSGFDVHLRKKYSENLVTDVREFLQ